MLSLIKFSKDLNWKNRYVKTNLDEIGHSDWEPGPQLARIRLILPGGFSQAQGQATVQPNSHLLSQPFDDAGSFAAIVN